jgi:hypothetical protein
MQCAERQLYTCKQCACVVLLMSCLTCVRAAAAAAAGALVDVLTGSSAADDSSFVVGRSLLGTHSAAAAGAQSTGGVSEASVRAANIAILWTSIGLGAVLQVSSALCSRAWVLIAVQ